MQQYMQRHLQRQLQWHLRHRWQQRLQRPCCRSLVTNPWACLETPNPNVRKFEWHSADPRSPLPEVAGVLSHARGRLLDLEGVRDVFICEGDASMAPWLAVTRTGGQDWEELSKCVHAALESAVPLESLHRNSTVHSDSQAVAAQSDAATQVEADIREVLVHRIRPSVQADGGDVDLVRWDASTGQVVLELRGACRGCPQSAVTLQETILRALQHFVPKVRSVVAEEEKYDEATADPYADLPWAHNGEPASQEIRDLAATGTPFFSTFAGVRLEGAKLRRMRFMSHVQLAGRSPGHIFVSCQDCKAKRTIEDPKDLLRADKGNLTSNAAVAICPTCCVLISE